MSNESGSASDVFDLLDKIAIFASGTLGWTINKQTADEIYLQSGSDYWTLKADNSLNSMVEGWPLNTPLGGGSWVNPGIGLRGARGFDTGQAWDAQPGDSGASSLMGVFQNTAVPEYWCLSDVAGDYLHVLARRDAQIWTELMMGRLVKFGSWTGGAYQSGQPWVNDIEPHDGGHQLFRGGNISTRGKGTAVNADIDGASDAWQHTTFNIDGLMMFCFHDWFGGKLQDLGASKWSGRTAMIPLMAWLKRSPTQNILSYSGQAPDARHLLDPTMPNGAEFVLGSDTWKHANQVAFKLVP